jgi:hypothetical protein
VKSSDGSSTPSDSARIEERISGRSSCCAARAAGGPTTNGSAGASSTLSGAGTSCARSLRGSGAGSRRASSSAAAGLGLPAMSDSRLELFAVLGGDGSPLVGEESLRRFNTFEEGPCSVLEAFASAAPPDVGTLRLPLRSKSDEPDKFGLIPAPGGRRGCPKGRAGEYRRRKRPWSPIHLV